MVYAASVDDRQFTFQPSGSLWRDALVMHDPETGSLWSQPTGECIQGEMEGSRLTLVPAMHTTYREFKKLYPHGQLLQKPERGEAGSGYAGYFADSTKLGIFGRVDDFRRLPAKALVLGVRLGATETAVTLDYLKANGFAIVAEATPPVIITYDATGQTSTAFALPEGLDPTKLKGVDGSISSGDVEWDARTGVVTQGKAANLEPVPLISSYWFAWASFFPETKLVK